MNRTIVAGGQELRFDPRAIKRRINKATWNLLAGLAYSGEFDFAPTEMYWSLNHMVTPAEKSLVCLDCHGDSGRLDWQKLGYKADPMRVGSAGEPDKQEKVSMK